MTAARVFLMISVAIWTPYAIYCVFVPDFLAGVAGLAATTSTGMTEIRSMYGGLQAGIGLFCLSALFRSNWVRPALLALCFLTGGLALTRGLGLMIDDSASGYTLGALAFEILNTAAAVWLLRNLPSSEPARAE